MSGNVHVPEDIETQQIVRHSPHSKVKPSNPIQWVKYIFWRILTPLHPFVRDTLVLLHIVNYRQFLDEKGRQKYLVGHITPGLSTAAFVQYLVRFGYGNNFIAWKDNGEVASLRLFDGFAHQYHIRVFNDREVRAHYEYSPEAHPIKHYYEVGMEERRDYFRNLFGDRVVTR